METCIAGTARLPTQVFGNCYFGVLRNTIILNLKALKLFFEHRPSRFCCPIQSLFNVHKTRAVESHRILMFEGCKCYCSSPFCNVQVSTINVVHKRLVGPLSYGEIYLGSMFGRRFQWGPRMQVKIKKLTLMVSCLSVAERNWKMTEAAGGYQ